MRTEKKDVINSICLFIFSVVAYIGIDQIPIRGSQKTEADFFPKIVLGIIIFLTLLLLINNVIKLIVHKQKSEKFSFTKMIQENKKVILTFVVFGAYVFLLDIVGYFISSILFLVILYLILTTTKRRIWVGLIGAVVITFVMFVIFEQGLSVFLPTGLFL